MDNQKYVKLDMDFNEIQSHADYKKAWEKDRSTYRIHCPDKKGTVWEVKRANLQKG